MRFSLRDIIWLITVCCVAGAWFNNRCTLLRLIEEQNNTITSLDYSRKIWTERYRQEARQSNWWMVQWVKEVERREKRNQPANWSWEKGFEK
jgi:hypothetical protein